MLRNILLGVLTCLPPCAAAQSQRTTKWESGTLVKGKKTEVWEYYSYSAAGEQVVSQRYDHTTSKLLFCRPDDQLYEAETTPGTWSRTLLTQVPWFIGGHEALAAYTARLSYPAAALARNVEGKVVVGFVIDTLGHVSARRLVRGIGSGCDEEALRVARTVPDTWVPGRWAGQAVPVVYELPFTFRLR